MGGTVIISSLSCESRLVFQPLPGKLEMRPYFIDSDLAATAAREVALLSPHTHQAHHTRPATTLAPLILCCPPLLPQQP